MVTHTPHIGLCCSVVWTLCTFTHYPDSISGRMSYIWVLKFPSRSSLIRRYVQGHVGVPLSAFHIMLREVQLLTRKYPKDT